MGNAILDLFISRNYIFPLSVSLDNEDGEDLESDYTCWFYCESIGSLEFTFVTDRWQLEISAINTNKITDRFEDYVVYAINTSDSKERKLISGRIVLDDKVRT